MNLRNIFSIPTTEEIGRAGRVVENLGQRKKLNNAQKEILVAAQELLSQYEAARRKLAIGGFIAATALTGIGYLVSRGVARAPETATAAASAKPVDSLPKNSTKKIEAFGVLETEKEIAKLEKGMENLRKALAPRVENLENQSAKKALMAPFDLMEINQRNPNKNAVALEERLEREGTNQLKQENINYFSYRVGVSGMEYAADYDPVGRIMNLTGDLDPMNMLDLVVVYHELLHAMQDTAVRAKLDSKEAFDSYVRAYTGKKGDKQKVFLLEEVSAYVYEIEVLNLLLDGGLQKSVLTGEPINTGEALKKLGAKPEQIKLFEMIRDLAVVYYKSGSSTKSIQIRKSVMDAVAGLYASHAPGKYELYESFSLQQAKRYR